MKDKLNVVKYDAGLQKLALFFHSGNTYLDYFLREDMKFSVENSDVECKSMYLPIEII